MDENTSNVIDSASNLINTLVHSIGKGWTIVLIFVIPIGTYFWKRYNNNRKDAAFKALIKEKDDTIERMKEEVKMYRINLFKDKGWTDEGIDKYIK